MSIPGLIELTRMPFGPSSLASDFISPMTAMRSELDRTRLSSGCFTVNDCVATRLPSPRSSMCGTTA